MTTIVVVSRQEVNIHYEVLIVMLLSLFSIMLYQIHKIFSMRHEFYLL